MIHTILHIVSQINSLTEWFNVKQDCFTEDASVLTPIAY